MRGPSELYRPSLGLLTDLYQLTMAAAAWKSGLARHEGVFHLFFRRAPYRGGFTVAAGLGPALDFIEHYRFSPEDLAYLGTLKDSEGASLFVPDFLQALGNLRMDLEVDAVPEGTVVFPHEPLLRIRGPILPCMLLETPLLNLINFQTLVATKAARIRLAAGDQPVLEFGLRRAQGLDGALAASRAAFLGGVDATSNALAGKLYDIPVRGTHAHSWVMLFDEEREAFEAYAKALPGNCVFLVDTYDTHEGVENAIAVGKWLRERGHALAGIRLDSGDLAYLSIEARRRLDAEGFEKTAILATNDLDEHLIENLKRQGAQVSVWGVGTRLVTGHEDGSLGGVYKLSAVRAPGGALQPRIKLSEQAVKISTPGVLQVRRFTDAAGACLADLIYDEDTPPQTPFVLVDPLDPTRRRSFSADAPSTSLLKPVFRDRRALALPTLNESRTYARAELARFHAGIKRFLNPHQYPVGLERGLYDLKTRLILAARRSET